ncbi:VanZ family protein [Planomicrobium sp. CPCC 101110]|uniref:VanZ family protein n=1 Tax=Planomicrobium sp. CPCC 101110 TaxID=2599619 RepID=UPI0011B6CEC4|nr:VanZ family protein [Planomicrobium sp. CPCC 101110]TWT27858.1 VanZ family protein [Planomicrobium sp. CPCC 101110]
MLLNIKFLGVISWIALIVIATCTTDARAFLFDQTINYDFEPHPVFSELLITNDIDFYDDFYLLQKIGHFTSFGILYVFILVWLKRKQPAFILCAIFGFFTEVLQLYFNRNGRLFDAFIDLLGVSFAFAICHLIKSLKRTAPSVGNN